MYELKIYVGRGCKGCVPVKDWILRNPYYKQFVVSDPPPTTIPILPSLIYNGKWIKGKSAVLRKLNEIDNPEQEI